MDYDNLARATRAGELKAVAFEEAYDHYRAPILTYIYSRVGNLPVAEELTAEVFARLVVWLRTFADGGRPLRAWLYVVARNLAIDYLRHDNRLQFLPLDEHIEASESAYPPTLIEQRLAQDSVRAALNYLTEAQRQVIMLKFMEGCSNAEAGVILGKDENSVKSLQHRALATLRRVLEHQVTA